jgi:hypothetical protein
MARTSGKSGEIRSPEADEISATPPLEATRQRTPDHRVSTAQPSPLGAGPGTGSISVKLSGRCRRVGSSGGSIRWIIQLRPSVSNSA